MPPLFAALRLALTQTRERASRAGAWLKALGLRRQAAALGAATLLPLALYLGPFLLADSDALDMSLASMSVPEEFVQIPSTPESRGAIWEHFFVADRRTREVEGLPGLSQASRDSARALRSETERMESRWERWIDADADRAKAGLGRFDLMPKQFLIHLRHVETWSAEVQGVGPKAQLLERIDSALSSARSEPEARDALARVWRESYAKAAPALAPWRAAAALPWAKAPHPKLMSTRRALGLAPPDSPAQELNMVGVWCAHLFFIFAIALLGVFFLVCLAVFCSVAWRALRAPARAVARWSRENEAEIKAMGERLSLEKGVAPACKKSGGAKSRL